jgi:hypothetical protein
MILFKYVYNFSDFRISRWFSIDVERGLLYLESVEVGCADISGEYAASTFRIKVSRVNECSCYRGWQSDKLSIGERNPPPPF